jgi:hypothetical protein
MSTSLNDLPLPGGQMPDMSSGAQQQFDLNSMIDAAATAQNQPQQQEDPSISSGALQYQMDPSQIPFNGPNPNIQIQEQYMDQPMHYDMMMQQEMEPEPELSFVQKITNEIKIPIIVAILFVILSLPQFNRLITRFIPRLLSETGDLNMMGLGFKAVIIAILVIIAKLFI